MIRVKIDLVPFGDETMTKQIAEMVIANAGRNRDDNYWYVCTITSKGPYGFRGTSEYLDALVESIGKPKKRPLKPIK